MVTMMMTDCVDNDDVVVDDFVLGSVLTCVKNGMIGECSVLDVLTSQYNVSQPSSKYICCIVFHNCN